MLFFLSGLDLRLGVQNFSYIFTLKWPISVLESRNFRPEKKTWPIAGLRGETFAFNYRS